jgi:hypothetical protein
MWDMGYEGYRGKNTRTFALISYVGVGNCFTLSILGLSHLSASLHRGYSRVILLPMLLSSPDRDSLHSDAFRIVSYIRYEYYYYYYYYYYEARGSDSVQTRRQG